MRSPVPPLTSAHLPVGDHVVPLWGFDSLVFGLRLLFLEPTVPPPKPVQQGTTAPGGADICFRWLKRNAKFPHRGIEPVTLLCARQLLEMQTALQLRSQR